VKLKWIAAAALAVASTALAAGGMQWIRRPAKLHADRSASAPVVGRARVGDRAIVLERAGSWRKVSVGGSRGWVHRSRLTKRKPSRDTVAEGNVLATGDLQVARMDSAAGIRGLQPEAKQYAAYKGITQDVQDSVDRLDALSKTIRSAELQAFMKSGKLGEYSGGGK